MRGSPGAARTATSSRRIAITAGSLAVLLGALDTYVVVTIMTDIMRDVGIAINKIQQVTPIVTGYLLGYIAAMPLLGRASDRFGRKLLLQVSLAGFAVGSVVTALSNDLTTLVVGRVIQGTASGALLPVTLALAADLWAARNRAAVLGGIGAAQELGSVLGPLYGIAVVWLLNSWRDVFWINVPLAAIAMVMIHFSLPSRQKDHTPEKVDVVGGVLLAIALGLAVIGLYNPEPDGKQVLPSWGLPVLAGALVATVAFFVWERFARTRLIEPAGVHFRPFLAALGASLAAGAALMVTLVNVELFGQGVLGMDQNQAAGLLLRFLIALPIGALLGGWIATKVGDRIVAFVGLLIAAGGYWLISRWPVDLMAARHHLGLFTLPTLDTDLAIAGLGLGLVIGPLTSATLRVVPAAQHGIASAAVVVARMIGMLIGIAALSAWGLYRFNQHLQSLPSGPGADSLAERLAAEAARYREAYVLQYGEIFAITAIVCLVGALLGLLISGRTEHADEPGSDGARRRADSGDRRTDAGRSTRRRRRSPRPGADQTVRIQRATPGPSPAPLTPSAALDAGTDEHRLVTHLGPPVAGWRRSTSQTSALTGVYRRAEPILYCGHAIRPSFVLASAADDGPVWYECTGMIARIGCSPRWVCVGKATTRWEKIHVNDTGRQQNCIPGRARGRRAGRTHRTVEGRRAGRRHARTGVHRGRKDPGVQPPDTGRHLRGGQVGGQRLGVRLRRPGAARRRGQPGLPAHQRRGGRIRQGLLRQRQAGRGDLPRPVDVWSRPTWCGAGRSPRGPA